MGPTRAGENKHNSILSCILMDNGVETGNGNWLSNRWQTDRPQQNLKPRLRESTARQRGNGGTLSRSTPRKRIEQLHHRKAGQDRQGKNSTPRSLSGRERNSTKFRPVFILVWRGSDQRLYAAGGGKNLGSSPPYERKKENATRAKRTGFLKLGQDDPPRVLRGKGRSAYCNIARNHTRSAKKGEW